jgi:hypothetical protein
MDSNHRPRSRIHNRYLQFSLLSVIIVIVNEAKHQFDQGKLAQSSWWTCLKGHLCNSFQCYHHSLFYPNHLQRIHTLRTDQLDLLWSSEAMIWLIIALGAWSDTDRAMSDFLCGTSPHPLLLACQNTWLQFRGLAVCLGMAGDRDVRGEARQTKGRKNGGGVAREGVLLSFFCVGMWLRIGHLLLFSPWRNNRMLSCLYSYYGRL